MKFKSQTLSLLGLILMLIPGISVLIIVLAIELGQFDPLIMLLQLLTGGIIGLIGFITYLVVENRLKRKIITILTTVVFYAMLLPITWGINGLKERIYIYKHSDDLETIASQLLTNEISIIEANKILKTQNSVLKVICVPKENKHVLFILDGFLDNCSGFSYSLTDKEPSTNCCGDLTSWKKIRNKWYKWTTT